MAYHHLDFVKFESKTDGDSITLSFLNRRVSISGKGLRELALGFQNRSIESISAMPSRYSVLPSSGGAISEFRIEENA